MVDSILTHDETYWFLRLGQSLERADMTTRVIGVRAAALIEALAAAGVPHETLLYEDTTHYLDAYHPTPATGMVFQSVLDYAASSPAQ